MTERTWREWTATRWLVRALHAVIYSRVVAAFRVLLGKPTAYGLQFDSHVFVGRIRGAWFVHCNFERGLALYYVTHCVVRGGIARPSAQTETDACFYVESGEHCTFTGVTTIGMSPPEYR